MDFSISDYKVGQRIDTPSKIKLWECIFKRTFGGLDCAMRQYEKYSATGNWQSYKINGMIGYLDELTDGDYGRNHKEIKRVAGTLATQFKKKFPSIHYLMSNSLDSNAVFDRDLNISPPRPKIVTQKQTTTMDRPKVLSILSELFSKNLSVEESKYIGEKLIDR
jgi:hypothetical protein